MSTGTEDYHGQRYVEGQPAEGAPARPERGGAESSDDHAERGFGHIETFAKVVFEGSFGLGCGGKQRIVREHLTLAQARQTKWDFYGFCSNHMVCYDDRGHPVHEE